MSSSVQDPGLLAELTSHLLVPVVVIDEASTADSLGDALVAVGLPVAEVTFRTAAGLEALRRLAGRGDLLVGAGTVLTAAQVDQAVAAGARFIVSPGLSRAVVERCLEHQVLPLPGAVTATAVRAVGGSWMVPRNALGDTVRVAELVGQAVSLATALRP